MSNRLIQYGFTAGIVSKTLWSQTILQKYGWGLADCKNYIIEYSGMLTSRPGLVAGTICPFAPDVNFRFVPFVFAEEDANTFEIIFIAGKIFFAQQGSWVLEDAKSVTAVVDGTSYTEFACTGHGYSVGDFVEFYGNDVPSYLVGQTVRVSAVPDADTFRVQQIEKTASMDGWADAATAAVSAYRLYTITSPYADDDLAGLYFDQARDIIDITSHDFPPYQLERQNDGTWTLTEKELDVQATTPTGLAIKGASGSNVLIGGTFAVTSVNALGEESLAQYAVLSNFINYEGTAGWVVYQWDPVSDADYYKFYRSPIGIASQLNCATPVGFVSVTYAPEFYDSNQIAPNYTDTPPLQENPFVNSAIKRIRVTAAGSGYASTDTIAITDSTGPGVGATANLIVDSGGEVVAVQILTHGKDYETPVVAVTTVGGTGATFEIETTPSSGNYPLVSTTHQQRKLYANTQNDTLALWGSQIGLFDNFTKSRIVADDDSYEYELSSPILGEIRHMVSTRSGLLVFTNIGVWTVVGSNNSSITATDVQADLQTSTGGSMLRPISIDSDILYGEVNNKVIRLLQYNHYSRQYGGIDISILARDLLSKWYDLNSWSFEARPYKLVWSTRNDGQLLSATISQEQEVYAWARHDTNGEIEQNITIPESDREVTYCITKRYLNGRWIRVMEYFANRERSTNENHCGVDCAVSFGGGVQPAVLLEMTLNDPLAVFETGATGTAVVSGATFTIDHVGSYIIYRDGKALIKNYVSATEVEIEVINDFTALRIPYSMLYKTVAAGKWYLTTKQSSFRLPLNFRPAVVTVFGDGKTFYNIAVDADGTVTFPESLAFGYIGFYYECLAVTLPFTADGTVIEDSRKNVKGVGIRFVDSKNINVGTDPNDLYPLTTYFHENLLEATKLKSGHEYTVVNSDWDENTLIYIQAPGAVPTQVTGIVVDLEVGDDVD